jgi:acetoin utilization deacetylase AcuC-like enzyme
VQVVYTQSHRLHDPQHDVQAGVAVPHVEQPERAERIVLSLQADSAFSVVSPTEHGLQPIEAVHAPGLIAFLAAGAPAPEQFPDTVLHPALRAGMGGATVEPQAPVGRIGYWCFDTGTPLRSGTYDAARGAVDVALTAADLVLSGAPTAYGLCRPPGHHAAHAVFGGFCYFNNAAIAADYLARHTGERIAVLDLDYHHGNGTQQIFYARTDVQFVSLHGDPMRAYPYFVGHADETGSGAGRGTTLNIPLPEGTTDNQYLAALDRALEAVVAFAPFITVVSLGMDTYRLDPLGDFRLTTAGYYDIGHRVRSAASRLVILQEGGYSLPDLGANVHHYLRGAALLERT